MNNIDSINDLPILDLLSNINEALVNLPIHGKPTSQQIWIALE
jgi:hypothetical protein